MIETKRAEDALSVSFPKENAELRGILGKLARIYDPFCLVSRTEGKPLYREACELKQAWDVPQHDELVRKRRKWKSNLPSCVSTRTTLTPHCESIKAVELHSFGDTSGQGVSAAMYAVVRQAFGTPQGLVAAKARLAKQRLTIPRLEFEAGHMAVNVVDNVRRTLAGFPVTSVYW